MTATVAGELKSGKLNLLEVPCGLRDGRVRVTIEEVPESRPATVSIDRLAFLRLPLPDRRNIMKEQADKLANHYDMDPEWRDWLTGDIIEY